MKQAWPQNSSSCGTEGTFHLPVDTGTENRTYQASSAAFSKYSLSPPVLVLLDWGWFVCSKKVKGFFFNGIFNVNTVLRGSPSYSGKKVGLWRSRKMFIFDHVFSFRILSHSRERGAFLDQELGFVRDCYWLLGERTRAHLKASCIFEQRQLFPSTGFLDFSAIAIWAR